MADEAEDGEERPQAETRPPRDDADEARERRGALGGDCALLGDEREGRGEGAAQGRERRWLMRASLDARREDELRVGAREAAIFGRAGRHGYGATAARGLRPRI